MEKQFRYRFKIEGTIQGVGFRPFLYRHAVKHGLTGFALNSTEGVIVEVQGAEEAITGFEKSLVSSAPPLAEILSVKKEAIPVLEEDSFCITESESGSGEGAVIIPPDISTCDKCFAELSDPGNRRYMYPFTNCTDCGPRYTIIGGLPYDREKTTMQSFTLCPECGAEYTNPADRRFHAEPNACPVCGPELTLWMWDTEEKKYHQLPFEKQADLIEEVITRLEHGGIIAIKGLGGFHLACNADDPEAVEALRRGKRRPGRPLAVMSRDIETIGTYAEITLEEREMLQSSRRPIVFLKKKTEHHLAPNIAPDNACYGVMLPYTPLHYILMGGEYRALVMTSANNSGEPIIKDNDEALEFLDGAANYVLLHNRDILVRCDDSITRWDGEDWSFLRVSRGWAPRYMKMASPMPDRLACGAELKNAFTITKKDLAYTSGHIGDLEDHKTYLSFVENIDHLKKVLGVKPELIIHDLHPDYLSSIYAAEQDMEKVAVQHHHAHVLSCMAQHGLDEPMIGIALDGTGYGGDGTIWGGEILIAERDGFERKYHLPAVPLPGGDKAAKEPWRMALSYIDAAFGGGFSIVDEIKERRSFSAFWEKDKVDMIRQMLEKELNSPLTSAAGRLFGAVSALLGIKEVASFEGEAEMNLEYVASSSGTEEYYDIPFDESSAILPGIKLFSVVTGDYLQGTASPEVARKFHNTLIRVLSRAADALAAVTGIKKVALTGGVFQNMIMLNGLREVLRASGLEPLTHGIVPANDAGISVGQAYYIRKV